MPVNANPGLNVNRSILMVFAPNQDGSGYDGTKKERSIHSIVIIVLVSWTLSKNFPLVTSFYAGEI